MVDIVKKGITLNTAMVNLYESKKSIEIVETVIIRLLAKLMMLLLTAPFADSKSLVIREIISPFRYFLKNYISNSMN